ncbi:MAG: aldehyde dehydrogenase family protein [Pseudomonadota bacterium]
MSATFHMTIGGKSYETPSTFEVENPATGAVAGHAPNGTPEDLDRAVAAAQTAFESWSQTSDETRSAAVVAAGEILAAHAEELAALITQEQGKPLNGVGSRFEMGGVGAWTGSTASLSLPMKVLQDNNEGRVEMYRKPLGVVGSITPWNWPVLIATWHLMPAIRTGNTAVIKPSPYTPLSTLRMVELINGVLPEGVVNVVTSDDVTHNLGAAMASHPGIRKIVFTGSCATGSKVMMRAAETMKRLTLELGGNDAGIVLPDVDPGAIAEGLFWGGFISLGQTCSAMKRCYVHEDVYDAVCDALVAYTKAVPVGDGMDEASIMGPVANQMQFDKLKGLVDDAKTRGRVLLGGDAGEGLFFPPTIIADLDNGDPLVDEEQFGPALPIIKYNDVDEVITRANDSENGLGGSVWSSDIDRAKSIATRMECGSVWINKHGVIKPNAPFGGVKKSGLGVEFGEEGLQEYTDIQVVFS